MRVLLTFWWKFSIITVLLLYRSSGNSGRVCWSVIARTCPRANNCAIWTIAAWLMRERARNLSTAWCGHAEAGRGIALSSRRDGSNLWKIDRQVTPKEKERHGGWGLLVWLWKRIKHRILKRMINLPAGWLWVGDRLAIFYSFGSWARWYFLCLRMNSNKWRPFGAGKDRESIAIISFNKVIIGSLFRKLKLFG